MEIDFKTVKALSSPTRVRILDELLRKGTTPTALSSEIGKSKSTVSSHLSKLQSADLIEKESEEGRKRVVYHPTSKAETIVKGKEKKIKFSLASSGLSAFAGLAAGFYGLQRLNLLQDAEDEQFHTSMEAADMGVRTATETAQETSSFLLSGEALFFLGIGFLTLSATAFVYGVTIKKLGD